MIKIELEIADGFDEKSKRMGEALRLAYAEAVWYWRDKYLKGHFRSGAKSKYDYKDRSPKYIKRKMRLGKPLAPLIYSGQSRNWLSRVSVFKVSANREMAIGRFTGAPNTMRYFWMTGTNQPNKPEEMKRVISEEERRLGEYATQRFLFHHERLKDGTIRKV